jgi:hypothetical protein
MLYLSTIVKPVLVIKKLIVAKANLIFDTRRNSQPPKSQPTKEIFTGLYYKTVYTRPLEILYKLHLKILTYILRCKFIIVMTVRL